MIKPHNQILYILFVSLLGAAYFSPNTPGTRTKQGAILGNFVEIQYITQSSDLLMRALEKTFSNSKYTPVFYLGGEILSIPSLTDPMTNPEEFAELILPNRDALTVHFKLQTGRSIFFALYGFSGDWYGIRLKSHSKDLIIQKILLDHEDFKSYIQEAPINTRSCIIQTVSPDINEWISYYNLSKKREVLKSVVSTRFSGFLPVKMDISYEAPGTIYNLAAFFASYGLAAVLHQFGQYSFPGYGYKLFGSIANLPYWIIPPILGYGFSHFLGRKKENKAKALNLAYRALGRYITFDQENEFCAKYQTRRITKSANASKGIKVDKLYVPFGNERLSKHIQDRTPVTMFSHGDEVLEITEEICKLRDSNQDAVHLCFEIFITEDPYSNQLFVLKAFTGRDNNNYVPGIFKRINKDNESLKAFYNSTSDQIFTLYFDEGSQQISTYLLSEPIELNTVVAPKQVDHELLADIWSLEKVQQFSGWVRLTGKKVLCVHLFGPGYGIMVFPKSQSTVQFLSKYDMDPKDYVKLTFTNEGSISMIRSLTDGFTIGTHVVESFEGEHICEGQKVDLLSSIALIYIDKCEVYLKKIVDLTDEECGSRPLEREDALVGA